MTESISVWLDDQIGISGQYLWLRKSDGTLLNAGGDALAESPASSGQFFATLAESRTGLGTLRATITGSIAADDAVAAGWLAESSSLVVDEYPQAGSSGGLTTEQADTLDSIAIALSGSAPVEPTGTTVFEHLESISSDLNSFATVAARLAVEGQILGFPAAIVRNADYHAGAESEILLTLQDVTGEPITEIAGTPVASVSWLFGMGTESSPNLITGTATWATDRLKIEWLKAATAGKPLGTLTWQIGATVGGKTRWLGGGTTRLLERQF